MNCSMRLKNSRADQEDSAAYNEEGEDYRMKQRIITAVIAIALFLPILIYGNIPFLFLIYAMATIGLYELIKMKKMPLMTISSLLSFLLIWILLIPDRYNSFFDMIQYEKMDMVIIIAFLLLVITVISKNAFTFDDAAFLMLSSLYIGVSFYYFFATRDGENGLITILFVLITIWVTDSGAYFVGRSLGKRKLWPEISPNKTVEGFLGGVGSAIIVAILFYYLSSIDYNISKLIVMALLISIFGQLGDLVQSAYKRHYGVKDSGNILPGHGGILDRFDSLIFILPILHFFIF
jgi:phosphatidate cytidylyltransferase